MKYSGVVSFRLHHFDLIKNDPVTFINALSNLIDIDNPKSLNFNHGDHAPVDITMRKSESFYDVVATVQVPYTEAHGDEKRTVFVEDFAGNIFNITDRNLVDEMKPETREKMIQTLEENVEYLRRKYPKNKK